MSPYRVGIIGCGRPWKQPGATGSGMAHSHAEGYQASPDARIVALADIKLENARAFQQEHGGDTLYTDYQKMLANEHLDIVSISTWPHLHGEMVIACAEAGVKAIHCEKPIAPTFGEANRMVQVCLERGVQLTFNHQRRFDAEFRKVRELYLTGVIGKLLRMEAGCPNMFDWGTHWFDMLNFYNDETPVEWVIAQVEPRGGKPVFDLYQEEQGISHFKYANGVRATLFTGHTDSWEGYNRLIGEDGTIELDMTRKPQVRYWGRGMESWQDVNTQEVKAITLGILDLIDALKTGREPELSARKAMRATEMIFATYESSRRHGRVELPLTIEDNPLDELVKLTKLT
jgi:predicted dehydrogenase